MAKARPPYPSMPAGATIMNVDPFRHVTDCLNVVREQQDPCLFYGAEDIEHSASFLSLIRSASGLP